MTSLLRIAAIHSSDLFQRATVAHSQLDFHSVLDPDTAARAVSINCCASATTL